MILLCQQPIQQVDDPDSVIVAKGHFVQCQNDFLIVIPDIAQGHDFAGESFLGGHVGSDLEVGGYSLRKTTAYTSRMLYSL